MRSGSEQFPARDGGQFDAERTRAVDTSTVCQTQIGEAAVAVAATCRRG